jgi:hypothetical protein
MGPKEVLEESVPEREHHVVILRNVALVAVMCVQCTAVMQTREQSEMVVDGIARLVWWRKCCMKQCGCCRWGVKWWFVGHGDGLFF